MKRLLWIPATAVVLLASSVTAQNGKGALDAIATAMGSTSLKTIRHSGSGSNFAVGQALNPTAPWPRFNVTSYSASVDYDTGTMRQEMVRTQGENPPRGGGGQPLAGEQRQIQVVSGMHAWNVAGTNATPAPAAVSERAMMLWTTPHGFVKSAQLHNAVVKPQSKGGTKSQLVTFTALNKWKIQGTVNSQNLLEKVETWLDNPVLGDMPIEITYSDYKDFGGVKFPTKIAQKQGGAPALDLTITDVQPNAALAVEVPANVKEATPPPVRVESQKLAEGVYYLTGGSHHSVLVEFKDHVAVIEGPQNEERSLAVIGEVKRLVPSKPIRYLVNTHQHFDHSGGIRSLRRRRGHDRDAPDLQALLREDLLQPANIEPRQARAVEEEGEDRSGDRPEGPDRRHARARAASDPGQRPQRWHPDGVPAGRRHPDRSGRLHAAGAERAAARDAEPVHRELLREHSAAEARRQTDRAAAWAGRHHGRSPQGDWQIAPINIVDWGLLIGD